MLSVRLVQCFVKCQW